jgi:hypothetical protein
LKLITEDRECLNDTSIVNAVSAMEMLIARCDRILKLTGHRAEAVSPPLYWKEAASFYKQMSKYLSTREKLMNMTLDMTEEKIISVGSS